MNKVFLGGTCNLSTWRDELIPMLKIDFFNPVVTGWTAECQKEEERQKSEECNIHLYVITPRMTGVYSIAEIIESSHCQRVKTIVCIKDSDNRLMRNSYLELEDEVIHFSKAQMRSLEAVCNLAKKNGAIICSTLEQVADYLNHL